MGNSDKWRASVKATRLKKYQDTPFEKLGMENRRRRVFEDQDYTCNGCNLSEWRSKPIVLELEHKDGNNQNDERTNLEGLCPNCHAQTPTWRGRNKKATLNRDSILKDQLKVSKSIRAALIASGLTPSGKNYETANRLLIEENK